MSNKIVLDLETQQSFQEIGSRDPSKLKISVVGLYNYQDSQFKIFREAELANLWPILENCNLIIGFNLKGFDHYVLNGYYSGDIFKLPTLDLLEEIEKILGFRVSLDNIAKATLGSQKIGHGLQAIEWFRQGDYENLEKYALEDVKITRDIYEYALANNKLFYTEAAVGVKEISLPADSWNNIAGQAVNYTLPF